MATLYDPDLDRLKSEIGAYGAIATIPAMEAAIRLNRWDLATSLVAAAARSAAAWDKWDEASIAYAAAAKSFAYDRVDINRMFDIPAGAEAEAAATDDAKAEAEQADKDVSAIKSAIRAALFA